MGNPLVYRNMGFTWDKGRELKQIGMGGSTILFKYDPAGGRISKTVDGVTTKYYTAGDDIVGIKKGNNLIHFIYDEKDNLFSMQLNGEGYYYIFNGQNDVIGLVDSSGKQVVSYTYNSWGKMLSVTDTSGNNVGSKNPFRYRGYCYDEETGLYYVGSRYYDPEVGRFISADSVIAGVGGDLRGYNLYSYSFNNPTNMRDPSGSWPKWLKKATRKVKKVASKVARKIAKVVKKAVARKVKTIAKKATAAVKKAITNMVGFKATTTNVHNESSIPINMNNINIGARTTATIAGNSGKYISMYYDLATVTGENGEEHTFGVENSWKNTDVSIGTGGFSYKKMFGGSSLTFSIDYDGNMGLECAYAWSGENSETSLYISSSNEGGKILIAGLMMAGVLVGNPLGALGTVSIPVMVP